MSSSVKKQSKKVTAIQFKPGNEGEFKFTVVGDKNVGKTCLLVVHHNRNHGLDHTLFPSNSDLIPETMFRSDIRIPGEEEDDLFPIVCQDTKGHPDHDNLRFHSYLKTDVFMLCYAIDDENSFKSIEDKWLPELQLNYPTIPVFLIGTKSDLADKRQVDWTEGQALSRRIKAGGYSECSALTEHNLNDIFRDAVALAFSARTARMKKATKYKRPHRPKSIFSAPNNILNRQNNTGQDQTKSRMGCIVI